MLRNLYEKIQRFIPLAGLLILAAAFWLIHHEIHAYHWTEISSAVRDIPITIVFFMVVLTLLGYVLLSFYDRLGLEYARENVARGRVLLTAFIGYALSNNVGYSLLSGGTIRYRFYSAWGVPGSAIARVMLFGTLTYFIGALTLIAGSAVFAPSGLKLPGVLPQVLPMLALGILAIWWIAVLFLRNTLQRQTSIPAPWLALRQTLVAVADLLTASLVLYVPLFHYTGMPFESFLLIYISAQLAGILSQVPGGIGVFEASFLYLCAEQYPSSHIFAALLAYRAIYYLLPLVMAGCIMAVYEYKAGTLNTVKTRAKSISGIIPQLFAVLLLLAGGILLFSGATPATSVNRLHHFMPLSVLELSHFVGSIAGVLMLFLAHAVWRRLDSAYIVTIVVLGIGICSSLLRSNIFDAIILCILLAAFIPARRHFFRTSALLAKGLPGSWFIVVLAITGSSVWLGFFSYKHTEYASELWWQFSLHGDASRFLRSLVGIAVLFIALLFHRLLSRTVHALMLPAQAELDKADTIIRLMPETEPHLALMGDKYLFWSKSGSSFLMFGTTAGYWIVMGDPAGNDDEFEELIWNFREAADYNGAKTAFYQVSVHHLPLYIDMGFSLIKLGEEARVLLSDFNLEGRKKQSLRHSYNKNQKEGLYFDVIPASKVPDILSELQVISELWLQDKKTREKRFSLGYFHNDYLSRCSIAVLRNGEQKIIAFANLWQTELKKEISVDLMRYDPAAPSGVMEFLLLSVMFWGKSQNIEWFNLGMAPLSGLEKHPLAPLWHKIGNKVFHMGGEFYNFEGLYHYKNKFEPVWTPRYLAVPAGLSAPAVLLAVTKLISGGLKGIVLK